MVVGGGGGQCGKEDKEDKGGVHGRDTDNAVGIATACSLALVRMHNLSLSSNNEDAYAVVGHLHPDGTPASTACAARRLAATFRYTMDGGRRGTPTPTQGCACMRMSMRRREEGEPEKPHKQWAKRNGADEQRQKKGGEGGRMVRKAGHLSCPPLFLCSLTTWRRRRKGVDKNNDDRTQDQIRSCIRATQCPGRTIKHSIKSI